MNIDEILQLSIEKDLEIIINSPPPELALKNFKQIELEKIAAHFSCLWHDLLTNKITTPYRKTSLIRETSEGTVAEIEYEDFLIWDKLILALGSYYDYSIRAILPSKLEFGKKEISLFPGLNLEFTPELFSKTWKSEVSEQKIQSFIFASHYFNCLKASYFLKLLQSASLPRSVVMLLEEVAHNSLVEMHKLSREVWSAENYRLISQLTHSSLTYLASIYDNKGHGVNIDHAPGIFSEINLSELSLLARRDPLVAEKYGDKNIEKLFERQLALIFQSMGFYVIQTKTGERTVDLICLYGDGNEGITILVEAKTSKEPYSLPSKDERALSDYVDDVRKNLVLLPRLKLVLVVGYDSTNNLSKKLKNLENSTSTPIPIRFCKAQDIARLRESIPGVIPVKELIDLMISMSHVVPSDFVENIIEQNLCKQEACIEFVRKMLKLD